MFLEGEKNGVGERKVGHGREWSREEEGEKGGKCSDFATFGCWKA